MLARSRATGLPVFPNVEGRAFLLVALLCVLASTARVGAQQPATVTGWITDDSGAPIEGAAIEVIEAGVVAWSDANGSFRLRLSAGGDYTLRASRMGWATRVVRVQARPGSAVRIDIALVAQPVALAAVAVRAAAEAGNRMERTELLRSGAQTVAAAVARLPGVVLSSAVPGTPQFISVRGSAHDQVLVLVDGVAINDPITGAADLSTIPAAAVETITLLTGAQSASYGGRALAGALLIETRRAGAAPALNLGSGSLGLVQSDAAFGGNAALSWSAGASWRKLDGRFGFRLPPELGNASGQRSNADAETLDGFATLAGALAGGVLRVRSGAQSEERGMPGRGYAPSLHARQELRGARVTSSWERERPAPALRLHAGATLHRSVYRDHDPPFGIAYNDSLYIGVTDARAEYERRTARARLGLGVDANLQHIRGTALSDTFRQPAQLGAFLHGTRTARLYGLDAGVNVELRIDHDRTQDRRFLSHAVTLTSGGPALSGYISHRTGYAPPTLGDQFFRESVGVQPNPALRAERVRELEAGLQHAGRIGAADLDVRAAAFIGNIRDLIVWAPDFRYIWSPRNHDVLRNGIDVAARAALGPRWFVSAHGSAVRLTYDRPGDRDDGVQVVYRPRFSAAATLEHRVDRLDARFELNYNGARNTAPNDLNVLPAYWTTAAGGTLRFQLWRVPAALQARIDRPFDEDGALIFGFPHPGRTFTATLQLGGSTSRLPQRMP